MWGHDFPPPSPSCCVQLEVALAEAEELVRTAEDRMQQLRAELLLREESYNKNFKNGGAGEHAHCVCRS